MAFFSKASNVFKQTVNRHMNSEVCGSGPFIFQIIRSMSSSRLFVGGISYNADNQGLQEVFSKYGHVVEARILVDRETGRSRGFGFVTFSSTEEASAAIQALDGTELYGRTIGVKYAHDRAPRSGGYGGGGFYDGNYNGGGGRGYPDSGYRSNGFRCDDGGAGGDLAGGGGGGAAAYNYGNFGGGGGDGGNFGHSGGYPSEASQNTDMSGGNYVDDSQGYAGGNAAGGSSQG